MCIFRPLTQEEIKGNELLHKIQNAGGFVEKDEHIPKAPANVLKEWENLERDHFLHAVDHCPRCKRYLLDGHLCPSEV